jgi:FtsZ-interacting cell division protein YlmF
VTTIATWGPTLVMACSVVLAGILGLTYTVRARRGRKRLYSPSQDSASAALSASLHEAEQINAYSPALQEDPSVHFRPIARIAPASYQEAIHELTRYFTQGRVVSIDLAGLSEKQSARLVDFCSGYLTGASGWLFRAAEKVIVLTPTNRKTGDAP